MNLPMNLRDLSLWETRSLRGFALPHKDGNEYHVGDVVGIQEPFRRLLILENTTDPKQKRTTAGIVYRSDGGYAWEGMAAAEFQEAKQWSPASQLPDYAIRHKATITGFEVKPLQSFTDEDIRLLCLDYPFQHNPQLLLADFLPIKNFELMYGWWKEHYRYTLKGGDNPMTVILHLVPKGGSKTMETRNAVITEFRGDYFFLSNFYIAPVFYQGVRFENNEAAFQAAKCPERMRDFCGLNPQAAKRLGRRVELRPDWEEVKYDVMYQICKAKFLQNPDLAGKLLETGDAELVEGNTWGDKIWGVCKGVGENNLGKILMRIREELRRSCDDPFGAITDEVGGYHDGGCGWCPDGTPCGECNDMSCGSCNVYLSKLRE